MVDSWIPPIIVRLLALNDDELNRPVAILIEQFGPDPDRAQFADFAFTMLDDKPGFETITTTQANRYIVALWRRYLSKPI